MWDLSSQELGILALSLRVAAVSVLCSLPLAILVAHGLARVALETGIPIAFGVLTTDSVEQAVERAGGKNGNKGAQAAVTAIEMANLLRRLEG